jgi:hypothetical protein
MIASDVCTQTTLPGTTAEFCEDRAKTKSLNTYSLTATCQKNNIYKLSGWNYSYLVNIMYI